MRYFFLVIAITILTVFCFAKAQGQAVSMFGATRAQDTSKTKGQIVAPVLATGDTNKVVGVTSTGQFVLRTKGGATDTPSLQQVTDQGATTTNHVTAASITLTTTLDNGTPDGALVIDRTLNDVAANGHGFRDMTVFSRTGYSYNSIDGQVTFTGGGAIDKIAHDHGAFVQGRYIISLVNNDDTVNDIYTVVGLHELTKGHIKRVYNGGEAWDIVKGVNGSVGINYGWAVRALTAGVKNFAFYSAGQTSSSFGGNIGVGLPADVLPTPNPIFAGGDSNTVHINGNFPNVRFVHQDGVNDTTDFSFGTDQLNVLFYTDDSMYYRWYTKGAEIMRATPSGKLLIGGVGESADAKLSVTGGVQFISHTQTTPGDSVFTTNSFGLLSQTSLSATYLKQSDATTSFSTKLTIGGDTKGASVTVGTNDAQPFILETTGTEALRIFGNGNVQLGGSGTDPVKKLDVIGRGQFANASSTSTAASAPLVVNALGNGYNLMCQTNGSTTLSGSYTGSNYIMIGGGGFVNFTLATLGAAHLILNPDGAGKVGVSTTSPTSELDVTGVNGYTQFRLRTSYTPTGTADANGSTGDVAWDADYMYIKTGAGWKRTALTTW